MDNKKFKISVSMIAGLTVIAGSMFVYQNLYYNKQQLKEQSIIYVAKTDIQAKTKITADMFTAKQIPTKGLLNTFVTADKLNSVIGKELKGGLLTGEPLTSVRIASKNEDLSSDLILKLEPDYVSSINPNDNVKVYVMLTDKNTGEVQMKNLFSNKKVISSDSVSQSSLVNINNSLPSTDNSKSLFINVTDQELQDYYRAKATGKIIVSKITDVDLGDISSTDKTQANAKENNNYDAKSTASQNSYRATDNKDNSIAVETYTVKQGDTIDSICTKFKTTKDAVSKLNDNNTTFKQGDKIIVPAN